MHTKCIQMERRDLVILQGSGEFTWKMSDCEELVGICIIENHEFIDSQSLYFFHGSEMR